MARNRKTQSAANRFAPAIKALVICLLLGGSGVGYVWQKDQILRLGNQIKARETRLMAVDEQNDKQRKQLANLRSPPWIEARIKELNLGLVPPLQVQVWHMPEPVDAPTNLLTRPALEVAQRSSAPPLRR